MIIQELEQVEIDHCHSCAGIWLDTGELELLLGDQPEPLDMMAVTSSEKRYRCPICHSRMEKVRLADDETSPLLDRCTNGHGIWFDADELHKVIGNRDFKNPIAKLLREMFGSTGI